MMVKTTVTLTNLHGEENDYEVCAYVDEEYSAHGRYSVRYEVSEPEFSAPDSTLEESRLAADPQGGEVFPGGWSEYLEEALVDAYCDAKHDALDPDEFTYTDGDY